MSKNASPPLVSVPVPDSLQALTQLVQGVEGFHPVVAALKNGHGATIDGAWGSASALATAALGLHAPQTLLVVLAHPGDLDDWSEELAGYSGQRPVLFPAWDSYPPEGPPAAEVSGQRLRLLKQLEGDQPPRYVLTTMQALMQPVPDRAQLVQNRRRLKTGDPVEPDELAAWLVEHGFERTEAVELPGEFSRRGGILDVYSLDAEHPFRLEFFGDEIESIRQFSAQTQRSLGAMPNIEILASGGRQPPEGNGQAKDGQPRGADAPRSPTGHLCEYLPRGAWVALIEPDDLQEQGRHYLERVADGRGLFSIAGALQQLLRFPSVRVTALPSPSVETTCHLRVESVERFSGDVKKVRDELDTATSGDLVLIACHNDAERQRLAEVLNDGQLARDDRLRLVLGRVRAGFRLVLGRQGDGETGRQGDRGKSALSSTLPLSPSPRLPVSLSHALVVLGNQELFHREAARPVLPRRRLESRAIDSFLDLAEGDLVVHVSHGIARYRGMQMLTKNGKAEEHLILEFRDAVRVYVPASKIDLVQKYIGGGRSDPELSKFGGTSWQNKKDRVEAAVIDLASDMIELHALREAQPGHALPPDSPWQAEFEAEFPYQETPDQLTTLGEIKRDLERPRPMDRLICGDVGYGKTELAIRAAFKAVDNGQQVAVLVPTTVLAEQHFRTFSQRMADYPFVVEVISRFRTGGEQKGILKRLAQGGIDIIIGTHRLISADVQFKDLGLVIIDEEQRFGVEHKDRLKRLRQTVDVLTLTATPIPRTLHMSLLGIRDISNLETPPPDRLAIETRIVRFDPQLIRHAVLRELNRDGQVYFVHNRVYNIKEVAARLKSIVPEARISIVHGQMSEHELEPAMLGFVRREADILVATTIIESGLDIPNVNTIFINQADMYGLADLHQLRGRVGRYKHRAYAYLLLDSERSVTPTGVRRLKAIEEFTELGAGFKIAMRDLEIRGAGNILGTQQSGHIAAVGYELYCQLLEQAVRRMKNLPVKTPLEVNVDLPWEAFLPRGYVPGQRLRIEVYRRLARIRRPERLEEFRQELRDRFGPVPEPAEWLLRLAELRVLGARWQIGSIRLEKGSENNLDVVLGYRSPRQIQKLAQRSRGRLVVADAATAYFRLKSAERPAAALFATLKDLLRWPGRSL